MGTRFVYALALGVSGLPAPARTPNGVSDYLAAPDPATLLGHESLLLLRSGAIVCAALGLGLVSVRFRWRGVTATLLLLGIPHVRPDLVRAWAEGPLFLAFGLCTLAYGTRWFGRACGLAATMKLTALGLWPLLLWPGAHGRGRRWPRPRGVASALVVWTVLTPPAWFAGGPLYLLVMVFHRGNEYQGQSALVGAPGYPGVGGWFFPTRYLLPLELAATLALTSGAVWLWQRRSARVLAPVIAGPDLAGILPAHDFDD
jgi:hypothetical protein